MPYTHYAFSDDSKHSDGRFNSLALLTINKCSYDIVETNLVNIMKTSGIDGEFKWSKLKSAKYRFAAEKIVDFIITNLDKLRLDVLIWDLEDARHKGVIGRDDNQNLIRMYYHLVCQTLSKRWPIEGSCWKWFPDIQGDVDWDTLRDCIKHKIHRKDNALFDFIRGFNSVDLRDISPVESHKNVFVQVADLFAGLGAYSWGQYGKYKSWTERAQPLLPFEGIDDISFSNSEEEKFKVLTRLSDICKRNMLRVSLDSSKGFMTRDPNVRLNFWKYRPQGEYDKAPRRLNG